MVGACGSVLQHEDGQEAVVGGQELQRGTSVQGDIQLTIDAAALSCHLQRE